MSSQSAFDGANIKLKHLVSATVIQPFCAAGEDVQIASKPTAAAAAWLTHVRLSAPHLSISICTTNTFQTADSRRGFD